MPRLLGQLQGARFVVQFRGAVEQEIKADLTGGLKEHGVYGNVVFIDRTDPQNFAGMGRIFLGSSARMLFLSHS